MHRAIELAERTGLVLAAVSCAILMAMTVIDVLARPLAIAMSLSTEIGIYFGAAIIFLALGEVTRHRQHIRADFFEAYIPARTRPWLRFFFVDLVFLLYAMVLLWLCTELTFKSFRDGIRAQALMTVPIGWPQTVMVVGLGLLCVRLLIQAIADARALFDQRDDEAGLR
jgi:TRAP-type C4-dicarboxylate transport system permease small subunit